MSALLRPPFSLLIFAISLAFSIHPALLVAEVKPEPEPEYTCSITPTLPPTASFSASCADNVPEPEHVSVFPSISLHPTTSLESSHTDLVPEPEPKLTPSITPGITSHSYSITPMSPSHPLLASLPADEAPEIAFSIPSIAPTPSPSSSNPSNFSSLAESLPSLVRPTTNDKPNVETETETETETKTETETEKENEYTSPLSLTDPLLLPLCSILPESEYPEQPEHELVSQAVPVELPVARRQSLVFGDPDLKLFPTNTAPLSPPESPPEQRELFPAPLYVSNAPDPPQLTSQVRTLRVASLYPDSSLLTLSVSSTPTPSVESTEPESVYLPVRSIPLMLRSLLTLSHSPPSTIDVPEIVSTPPGLPPPVPSTSSDSSSIPARPPSLPCPQLSKLFRNPEPEPEPSQFSCSIPPTPLVPLHAPSSTDIPEFLCTPRTPLSKSLVGLILFGTLKSLPLPSPALLEASNAADLPHSPSVERILGVMTVDSVSIPLEDTSAVLPTNPSTLQHRTFEVTPRV
jgi:hypothetical protein